MTLIFLGRIHSSTPTTITTLTPLLEGMLPVKAASPFKNKIICFLDMLRVTFKAKKNDLVCIHTYSTNAFYYAWACAQVCRLKGVKYIPHLHGGGLPERMDKNSKWLNSIFSHASIIVTPSSYLKSATETRGFGPVMLIPNFIDLKKYPFKQRQKLSPRLLWVRAFHHLYRPEMAVNVLAQLSHVYPNASLCMIGPEKDGSMEACKQLAGKLNVADKVKFTGKLSKEEWTNLAEGYDIFINTTDVDNTPVSVIEAMALGLPVVSTNVGGIPYLLEHNHTARLVNKGDEKMMVQEIEFLMGNHSTAQSQIDAARTLVESFAWERIRPQWLNLIKHPNVTC